jgi:hypothetical protein
MVIRQLRAMHRKRDLSVMRNSWLYVIGTTSLAYSSQDNVGTIVPFLCHCNDIS